MIFYFLSDPHLSSQQPKARLDKVVDTQYVKLAYLLHKINVADKYNDAYLFISGDMFDRPRDWYLLPTAILLLRKYKVKVFAVFGQHDTYMYNKTTRQNTSLGILEAAGLVTILGKEPVQLNDWLVYGCNYGQDIPKPEFPRNKNLLLVHKEISPHKIPNVSTLDPYYIMRRNKGFNLIHCGDIHREFKVTDGKKYCFNTGPMVRREATLYNIEDHHPCYFTFDTDENEIKRRKLPADPGEQVLSREHIEQEEATRNFLDNFIEQVESDDEYDSADLINVINSLIDAIDNNLQDKVRDIISAVIEITSEDG